MTKKQSNLTHPIRDIEKLHELKDYLQRDNLRNYNLVNVLLNTGLRISDCLALRVKDIRDRERLTITIQKTGQRYDQRLNGRLRDDIDAYTRYMKADDYIFQSQRGGQLSRSQAHRIITDGGHAVGIERLSAHSLRKSYAYQNYKKNHDIVALMHILGHSKPSTTIRYIGLDAKDVDRNVEDFFI